MVRCGSSGVVGFGPGAPAALVTGATTATSSAAEQTIASRRMDPPTVLRSEQPPWITPRCERRAVDPPCQQAGYRGFAAPAGECPKDVVPRLPLSRPART